jgi:hypothetical protein
MRAMLLAAAFSGVPVKVPEARHLIAEGRQLLREAAAVAG